MPQRNKTPTTNRHPTTPTTNLIDNNPNIHENDNSNTDATLNDANSSSMT